MKKFFCINKLKKGIDEEEYKIILWEKNIFLFLKKFPNQNIQNFMFIMKIQSTYI